MRKVMVTIVAVLIIAAGLWATPWDEPSSGKIVAFTPPQVRWFTPSYYTDGRQRAQLFGDSSQGGTWVDRSKIPAGMRIAAHRHPTDELVTVIEGTWYVGEGSRFDRTKEKAYPAGSFVIIPAGVPHFVETRESQVIVQLSGTGKFKNEYVEH